MVDDAIKKIEQYKIRLVFYYDYFINKFFNYVNYIFTLTNKNIETFHLKIKIKKYYIKLGSHVSREFIFNSHSDFSLDEKFINLNEKIKIIKMRLNTLKNK